MSENTEETERFKIQSEDEAYADGFKKGVSWASPWVPGGPFIFGSSMTGQNDPEWVAFCEKSKRNNKAWCQGWSDGKASQSDTQIPSGE